jgi:hypothetical protein
VEIFAEGDSLWLGTEKPAKLFVSKVGEWKWRDLHMPVPDTGMIEGIARIKGRLLCFGYAYPMDYVFLQEGENWRPWGEGHGYSSPYRLLTVGDTVWSATWEKGLYFRIWGDSSWTRMPSPRNTWLSDTANSPRGLAWYKGDLGLPGF